MHKKVFPSFLILIFFLSCSSHDQYEQAIDYFYPLEKGKAYIYNSDFGTDVIKKIIRVEEITKEKEKVLVRISETLKIPSGLRNEFESSGTVKFPETIKNEYEYIIRSNLIKRKQIVKDKSPKEFIYLKGPIRKGISWKTQGTYFLQTQIIEESARNFKDENNLQTPNHTSKKEGIKYFKIKATITDIREEDILGQTRKFIEVTNYFPVLGPSNLKPELKMIFCKGIGYVSSYMDDEEWEKLVEIK